MQVAASFISELLIFEEHVRKWDVWASTEVDQNLKNLNVDLTRLPGYRVVNSYGFRFIISSLAVELKRYEVVFTVFGPLYSFLKPRVSIVGFAQAWIVCHDKDVFNLLGFNKKILYMMKFWLQSLFFKLADVLVVEVDSIKKSLLKLGFKKENSIHVVPNCLSSLYKNPSMWRDVEMPFSGAKFKIGYVGRNYLHKNLAVLPGVKRALKSQYDIDADFFVTFTDEEWAACDEDFRRSILNAGLLAVAQCPRFYEAVDAVILPSLLECFSATPLEAMAMGKPVFVADKPFNRDVCSDLAFYFNATDVDDIAHSLAIYHNQEKHFEIEENKRKIFAFSFSSAQERARCYVEIVKSKI